MWQDRGGELRTKIVFVLGPRDLSWRAVAASMGSGALAGVRLWLPGIGWAGPGARSK